jgi:HPt (histidine-containing phosphotransfer) domain-containing protein
MVEESGHGSSPGAARQESQQQRHPEVNGAGGAATPAGIAPERIMERLETLGLLEDLDMAQEVIDVFVYDAGQSLDELGRAVHAGDAKACERLAHRVKGSSLNLGIDGLGALACTLEEKGRSGNLTGAADLYATMRLQYDALCSIAPEILHRAA